MKLKEISLLIFCSGIFQLSNAQENALQVSSSRNSDKSVDITFDKFDPGTMTVVLDFKRLANSNLTRTSFKVEGYSGVVTTLKPTNKDQGIEYSYSYRYIRGGVMPKIDKDFVYAIPFKPGVSVLAREAGFLKAQYFGNTTPEDWKVYNFYTDEQQEIVASRKGIVVEVIDLHDDSNLDGVSYSSRNNSLLVEHADGSLLKYSGISKGSCQVKIGDTVFPGQALAKNVKRAEGKYSVTYSLMYLQSANLGENKGTTMATTKSFYGFITPIFETSVGNLVLEKDKTYTASINADLVNKEMSKKELKKFGAN